MRRISGVRARSSGGACGNAARGGSRRSPACLHFSRHGFSVMVSLWLIVETHSCFSVMVQAGKACLYNRVHRLTSAVTRRPHDHVIVSPHVHRIRRADAVYILASAVLCYRHASPDLFIIPPLFACYALRQPPITSGSLTLLARLLLAVARRRSVACPANGEHILKEYTRARG